MEFALLVPVLFAILFGIIDYGLWFSDSLNVRQGVREGARAGVVQNFSATGCTTGSQPQRLACVTKNNIGALTGPTYVRITAPNGWVRGRPLLVCAMVEARGATGLAPLPSDGLVKSRTSMSIEVTLPAPTTTPFTYDADAAPDGGSWAWCS